MELATRYLTKQMSILKQREISLSSIRSLVVVAEERPRIHLTSMFTKLFSSLGLTGRAVSTSFGCRVNLAISLQGASSPESTTVYVDRVSLRNDRVKLLEKGSPHSLCLMESGKLLPGVHVVIANPDTLGQCADSQLGEIWVSSPHNSTELLGPFDSASLNRPTGVASQPVPGINAGDSLHARLVTGDTERVYARTGFLGFVRRTELTQSDGELHDAIFVVGSLEETILLRGMRFHPVDIENTVMRSHKKICECAVFSWSNLLVVVAELAGEENEAMDLVHPITAHVLTEHQMIVGVVVIVDPRTVPINPSGEKQRILLRDSFVNDKLDPIYVSYNM
uniref:DMAP1-binding domain-containing protein n=4 Tax=Schistosoma TaxID=6181 RepID=A0A5K4F290_SCHMA